MEETQRLIKIENEEEFDSVVVMQLLTNNSNWEQICKNYELSLKRVEKYFKQITNDEMGWYCISKYQNLSMPFISRYRKYVNWSLICEYQYLNENFIEEFKDYVDWYKISRCQRLNEDFIEKNLYNVDWHNISEYQYLSEEFIIRFKDYVGWDEISQYQNLSVKFIYKYSQLIHKSFLKHNRYIPKYIRDKIKDDGYYYAE